MPNLEKLLQTTNTMTSLPKDRLRIGENCGADRPPAKRSTPWIKRTIVGFLTGVVCFPGLAQTVSIEPVAEWPGYNRDWPSAFAVSETHAVVGSSSRGGLWVIDIRDPANPTRVGTLDRDGGQVTAMAVSGNLVYLADFQERLLSSTGIRRFHVVDISDPTRPRTIGTLELNEGMVVGASVVGLAISGSHAVLA